MLRRRLMPLIGIGLLVAACSSEPETTAPEADTSEDVIDRRDGGVDTGVPDTDDPTDTGEEPDTDGDTDDGDVEDTTPDTDDDTTPDTDTAVDTTPDTSPCETTLTAYTGLAALDINGDPLEVGDEVAITIEVFAGGSGEGSLIVEGTNLSFDTATLTRDGAPYSGATVEGRNLTIPLGEVTAGVFEVTASTVSEFELVTVFASIEDAATLCEVPRSRSGSLLQLLGGTSKTPLCVDMREVRSVQVAPYVEQQNTQTYFEANGARDDLLADDFIFCPQNPTIVHEAEFCLIREGDQDISLAGSYLADSYWEVDDFILFEVTLRGELTDGFTSQSHNGGDTFWCGEIAELMCTEGCTASLTETATGRELEPIAVAPAEGGEARRHNDREVSIGSLLPTDNAACDVRVTALDQGEVGTLNPGLYLISADPR